MPDDHLYCWLEDTFKDQVALRVRIRSTLHSSISRFQRIEVHDTWALGKVLCLGGAIALTDRDEGLYNEGLTHPGLACMPDARRVLILGGGDGGVAREVARYANVEQIDVVEIDEDVIEQARTFFPRVVAGLDDPRVTLHIDDAHRFLNEREEQQWDLIVIDADELQNASDSVQSVPFATVVARALRPDGVLIAPLGLPGLDPAPCRSTLHQLREHFAVTRCYGFTTPSVLGHQWVVAWCSQQREPVLASDLPDLGDRAFWDPVLHPGLFVLPRHIRRALAL